MHNLSLEKYTIFQYYDIYLDGRYIFRWKSSLTTKFKVFYLERNNSESTYISLYILYSS